MKKWQLRESPGGAPPPAWADDLNITPLLLNILWKRGLKDKESLDFYLTPKLSRLTRPENWPQVSPAARVLADAILSGKKFAVWGDYDVDGITASAVVLDVLEEHGIEAVYHLPDRMKEGYGLNAAAIEDLAEQGCEVLFTVDCGISNQEAVARANELGLTVVVSDHHLPPDVLPNASAIVDPRIKSVGQWPCEHLAGVGVAFYVMAALNNLLAPHTGKKYKMDKALDLVALGTLADIMRLEGENRTLVHAGLKHLAATQRPGMAALKSVSGFELKASLNSTQVVFRLAPRINAAGRMGHPELALKLLRSKDYQEAQKLAEVLNGLNNDRKTEENRIYMEARAQAQELLKVQDYAGLTLYGADWHPGIVGIVASRIVEDFDRPAIVLCEDKGSLKGSGRSVPDFDLYAGLEKAAHALIGYGGHSQAAGVRLHKDQLQEFREAFASSVKSSLGDKPHIPVLTLDCELDFERASNFNFLAELDLMQPFGPGNPEPVFLSPPLLVKRRSFLGHTREHVLLEVEDTTTGKSLSAKAWRGAEEFPERLVDTQIVIAYTPHIDNFRGLPTIDVGIKDWKPL